MSKENLDKLVEDQQISIKSYSDFLHEIKSNALQHFYALGFPGTRHEEWKYTPTHSFAEQVATQVEPHGVQHAVQLHDPIIDSSIRIVFSNGIFQKDSSTIPDSFQVISITDVEKYEWAKSTFNTLAKNEIEAFTALNTACFLSGIAIRIPKNVVIDDAILIEYYELDSHNTGIKNIRNLVVVEQNASVHIVTKHFINHLHDSHSNIVNEVVLKPNAQCRVYQLQDSLCNSKHITTWEIEQQQDAFCEFFTYAESGKLVRNNIHIALNAPGLTCDTKGVYIATDKNISDQHIKIEHKYPHGTSFQLFRGIVKDEATGVFNGKIFVYKDAQKTDAYQSNKNLLLSDTANMFVKPQLEIFADDVKCSHGAAMGNLDEKALFYCMARGISKEEAKRMLTVAFANEVLKKITYHPIRNYVEKQMLLTLQQENSNT